MKRGYVWLTLRLMRRQRARTMTIFSGIFLASVLLTGFGGLGAGFWQEVHGGSDAGVAYDPTQWILISLVVLLSAIVLVCAGMLLHNLMTLTFAQKWRSLRRLIHMGAPFRELTGMVMGEIFLIFCVAAPSGWLCVVLVCRGILGISLVMPWALLAGIFLVLLVISLLCGLWPLWQIFRKTKFRPRERKNRGHKVIGAGSAGKSRRHFGRPMPCVHPMPYGRRGRMRVQIVVCLLVSLALYVPAGYVINKNIQMNRSVLDQKFGIEYNAFLSDASDYASAMDAYQKLRMVGDGWEAMVYVRMPGQAYIPSELLSAQTLSVLEDAGWPGEPAWIGQGCLVFLEDSRYDAYLDRCLAEVHRSSENSNVSAILVNRVINRATYMDTKPGLYPETQLLKTDACDGIEIYYGMEDGQAVKGRSIVPQVVAQEPPEDFGFDGEVTVILPMRSFWDLCQGLDEQWDAWLYGGFADNDAVAAGEVYESRSAAGDAYESHSAAGDAYESRSAAGNAYESLSAGNTLYSRMAQVLEDGAVGGLRNSRQAAWEWYASLENIHKILNAISAVLFLIAIVNIFGTIFFQYMEQRHGLAIRWSVGATRRQLLWLLMKAWVLGLLAAIAVGIPMTGILCYAVYKVYRTVWNTAFSLPWGQYLEVLAVSAVVMVLAFLVQYGLMRRQDFLQEIKRAG